MTVNVQGDLELRVEASAKLIQLVQHWKDVVNSHRAQLLGQVALNFDREPPEYAVSHRKFAAPHMTVRGIGMDQEGPVNEKDMGIL